MSINYFGINTEAVNLLLSVKKHVSSIDTNLKALVELRVSQINGCAYCIDLHANEARGAGEPQQKIDCLSVWEECGLFSTREMAALGWAEHVTNISTNTGSETKRNELLQHFSEKEAVDLTLIIATMNAMNRMAISFGDKPPKRSAP
ncbi:MAG: carboxymuconolactone decarboxylase family protein [Hyphomicrobiales bacterium]